MKCVVFEHELLVTVSGVIQIVVVANGSYLKRWHEMKSIVEALAGGIRELGD